jgi:hypothetical protein
MKTKTASIIISNVMISEIIKTVTFREITEPDELEKAFRFRYDEYLNSRCHVFIKQNQQKADIDIYDLKSRHYGLYINNSLMIGYIRVVLDKKEYYNNTIFQIGKKYDVFNDKEHSFESLKNYHGADYPFLSYPNLPSCIKSYYESLAVKNDKIIEASRLIIMENFRGLRIISFFVECAISIYVSNFKSYKYAVVDCVQEHAVFYKRYGFQQIEHEQNYNILNMNRLVTCLYLPLSLSSIPDKLQARFEQMANEFSQNNKISRTI